MKYKCPFCNYESDQAFAFCPKCGKQVVVDQQANAVEAAPKKKNNILSILGFAFGILSNALLWILLARTHSMPPTTTVTIFMIVDLVIAAAGVTTTSIGIKQSKRFVAPGLIFSIFTTAFSFFYLVTVIASI